MSGTKEIRQILAFLMKKYGDGTPEGAHQDELRRLMNRWRCSGQSVKRVFALEPTLGQREIKLEALVVPVIGRTCRIVLGYLSGSESDPKLRALSTFVHFLLNSENQRLGGPCPACEAYFYKSRLRADHSYCSAICSKKCTSLASHRKERGLAKQEKIEKAKKLIKELKRSERKQWKQAIHRRHPEFSVNWLTRNAKFIIESRNMRL